MTLRAASVQGGSIIASAYICRKKDLPMRLGQLARKLSVSPAEVTALLATQNIQMEEGANARLTEEQLQWILQHYGKEMSMVTLAEEVAADVPAALLLPEEAAGVLHEPTSEASSSLAEPVIAQAILAESPQEEVVTEELPALIKAPKVELSGLKILGKIELPEPKKKEVTEKTEEEVEAVKRESSETKGRRHPTREDRGGNGRKPQRSREGERPRKNPVALQREREAREAEEKRQELARQEKERRTQYYQQRVKASVPTKPARLFDEPTTDMKNERKGAPKGWFGKLLRWFKS
jgi:hypothetical protein